MAYAAGDTFDCHEQPCAFWLTDAHNTFYAKQVNETEKRTVAAGFEATTDIDITKTKLTGGYWLNADVTDFGATGKPLKALDKDQLAEGICAVMEYGQREKICPGKNVSPLKLYSTMKVKYVDPSMIYARQLIEMIGKVARLKQPVSSLELSSDSGISAYPMHVTKSMSPLRRVGQVSLLLLFIFLSASQVSSSAEAKTESAEIGSCRFDLTSLATLSCVEPDGSWRPPSTSCCNALLRAIDHLPASNESGACCLCRYISKKYHHFALATSYVLCKGKDTSVITTWSSVPHHCYMACHRRNASSHGLDTTAAVLGTHSKDFSRIPWIAALIVASFCAIFLACFFYRRRYKPIPTGESHPLNLQRRVSPSEARDERKPPGRHSSAQRRMSSRGSPNG
ncbi:unnamed protein product [Urochloa decumbens]|uniref:Uncharacterized protein n=1 Tax=Urochloa decumbens TaxID=240449 RepID=A0ABC9DA01_9POAL